jgi:branched-chain amino acid transport system substrate-binding protein
MGFARLNRRLSVVVVGCIVAVALAACGSSSTSSSSSSASGGSSSAPIKVGNISGKTGPAPLPQSAEGAASYFDALNAAGGIKGQKIEFISVDDATNPATSAQLARQLVNENNVVGDAADLTLVGCAVNRKLFEEKEVIVVDVGSDPSCFAQKNISPVNGGQTTDMIATGLFAIEQLHAKKPCAWMTPSPDLNSTYPLFLKQVEAKTSTKFVIADVTLTEKANLAGFMIVAKEKGCDAIITNGTPSQTIPIINARNQQGLGTVPIIFQGSQYEERAAKAVGSSKGVFSVAEMEPFSGNAPVLSEMKKDLAKSNLEPSALAQFGWESAKIFASTLSKINGPITRQSVTQAFRALTSYDTEGMTGTPYAFGPGRSHNPNRSVKIVEIKNGKWTVVTPEWITLPASFVSVPPELIK